MIKAVKAMRDELEQLRSQREEEDAGHVAVNDFIRRAVADRPAQDAALLARVFRRPAKDAR